MISLAMQKVVSFLKYIYYTYYIVLYILYMYTKAFLNLIKAWKRTTKNETEKLEKQTKWNASTGYEIEKVKQAR